MKTPTSITILGLAFSFVCPGSFLADATTLNVMDFGARGDAVQTLAVTVSNSTLVHLEATNRCSDADVGKLIELFGVGPVTSGANHHDLIARIVSVVDGTNVTISSPASRTAADVPCTFGSQNADAFQNCVAACQGDNSVVLVPAGRYLLVPPLLLNPHFVMDNAAKLCPAIFIRKGGIEFQGDTPDNTVLLGNGAWVLKQSFVQRGVLFGCEGPVIRKAPLAFKNLTFDGGVQVGNQHFGSGPASPVDGSGWDITHDAVVDMGNPPFHVEKQFINCHFVHWRGEMLKSVVNWNKGLIVVSNCVFSDGDGSGFNFNWTPHVISGCLFSNLDMAIEYYVGTMQTSSIFENNTITNTRISIVLVGALADHPSPGYGIFSNTISATKYDICLGPARNVKIVGNTFLGGLTGVATDGYAYQGTDINRDILVRNNQFVNTAYPFGVGGDGPDQIVNVTWLTNTAHDCVEFAGGYGWSSNIIFIGNRSIQPDPNHAGRLDGSQLRGQWFLDDASNNFPPNQVYTSHNRLTNIVSYCSGMRQELRAEDPQGVYLLDTGHPERIPTGARLVVTNACAYPVTLYFTSLEPLGDGLVLAPGHSATCAWTNASWKLVQPAPPNPPDN